MAGPEGTTRLDSWPTGAGWSRRRLLASGGVGVLAALLGGFELVDHGVLPGRDKLDELDGACSVAAPRLTYRTPGPTRSGRFFSRARGRTVGYLVAYPPGHRPGDALPLVVFLHPFGGDHRTGIGGVSLARCLAGRRDGVGLPPMALVAVDGGRLYWNPHPGDDPMAMIVDELLPRCRALGLGPSEPSDSPPRAGDPALRTGVGVLGVSMGGYGALLLAETHPHLVSTIAAISPAIWTTYAEARAASPTAFASTADFTRDDVLTHAGALAHTPVRVASGTQDPFRPGVAALARVLPASAVVDVSPGCHDAAFFASQQHASLAFLGARMAAI